MALVRAVVGHVMRIATCPEHVRTAFMSLKVTWLFSATSHEVGNVSMQENIEQRRRKRQNEPDSILQVSS
jgi:hypothetical protein